MNLARELSPVKVEVPDRILEQFSDRHEITEIGIPPGGIVHPASPFVVLDALQLPHKREMDPVVHLTNSLLCKYPGLQPSPESVNPVERRGEGIERRGEKFGSPFGKMPP